MFPPLPNEYWYKRTNRNKTPAHVDLGSTNGGPENPARVMFRLGLWFESGDGSTRLVAKLIS